MKKTRSFLIFFVFSMSLSAQNIDADMKKLLEVSGTEANFKAIIPTMINSLKSNPAFANTLPDEFWAEFAKEAENSYSELMVQIVEVYKKNYTSEDIKQLIVFYESPIGKKSVQKMPLIQNECFQLGTEWGRKLGGKVGEKIQKKKD